MIFTPDRVFAAGVKDMPRIDGASPATWWNRIGNNEIAYFRDGGRTKIVIDWPGEPPPREGRAPSYKEYIEERLAETQTPRVMPEGVHKGRPRKRPLVDAAE